MILFTSVIDNDVKRRSFFSNRAQKTTVVYGGVTLFVIIFSIVYHQFSHEVTSFYMTWAALFPFVLGFVPFLLCEVLHPASMPRRLTYNLINAGVETVTLFSLMKGAFEIADKWTNVPLYLMICGACIWLCGMVLWTVQLIRAKKTAHIRPKLSQTQIQEAAETQIVDPKE